LKNLEKGQFYAAGDFIDKDELVKVGPVATKHLGATPEIVPPAPKELKDVLASLSEKLPAIIQEKLAPAVPKVAEIEARVKEKFEAQWQARLARKDKELQSIKNRLEAKYETEIADLKRKLDDAVRQATLKGGVSDLLSHPLVQKNLEKLTEKQRALVQLLETKGPQDAERCSLFLEIKPKSVPDFMYDINRKIPKLIENQGGRYISRLAKLFPVTEEAQAQAKETETVRIQVAELEKKLTLSLEDGRRWHNEFQQEHGLRKDLERQLETARKAPSVSTELPTKQPTALPTDTIPVEVTLRRTLTDFKVSTNKEVLDVDETTPIGKLVARGADGFFKEPQGFGAVMSELERRYAVSRTSGGTRQAVQSALEELVIKGLLDRQMQENQWAYLATPEFAERVKPTT
jgi:hypothetical protein